MSITSYATLQAAVAAVIVRSDMTANIPVWIQLAEADMNRRLRHWRMETRATLTFTSEYADMPADWLETIRLEYNTTTGPRTLRQVAQTEIGRQKAYADEPQFYAFAGDQIQLWPAPDSGTADLLYYAAIPALSDAAPTNWLLTRAPDAYLYGAAMHSAPILQEDERLTAWSTLFDRAMQALQRESNLAGWSAGMRASNG